ncbi:MAG: winged helix-turn-helix domain-containing protein [Myxococcaceae bacterium]
MSRQRRTPQEVAALRKLYWEAKKAGDFDVWRRTKAVSSYLAGKAVIALAAELDVTRGAINRWLQWYEAMGAEGLRTGKAPGPRPRLSDEQRQELCVLIEAGPQAAGFTSGLWTGPMIGDLIRRKFGVSYHNHYVPDLLHQLGFSVQRPRKRLARADAAAQEDWVHQRFPAIKKKPEDVAAL